jgi:hypothetical protein
MNELKPAINVTEGDTIQLRVKDRWTKPAQVDSIIKLATIWDTDKLHGVCIRLTNGRVASMDDEHPVRIVNA